MATLTIFAAAGVDGAVRCTIALIEDDQDLLKSIRPMTPAVAGANAKALKFKGPSGEWVTNKEPGSNVVDFKPIADTAFEIFTDLENVQTALRNADIVWDPTEADRKRCNSTHAPSRRWLPDASATTGTYPRSPSPFSSYSTIALPTTSPLCRSCSMESWGRIAG